MLFCRPDMTFAVDWALTADIYLSVMRFCRPDMTLAVDWWLTADIYLSKP